MDENEEINLLNNECIAISDVYLSSFYYKVVKRLFDIDSKANVSYLYRYAKIFNSYYDIHCRVRFDLEDRDDDMLKLLKSSFHYRILYIYRNGTLFSSAVAFHFRTACEQISRSIRKLTKKYLVKICSIGGCSAPDIVAIITVLKSIALKNGNELDFRVTIIDFNKEWETACITVLSCLEEFHKATWKINFIQSNLAKAKTLATEVWEAVQEADVMTMVRFESNLNIKRIIIKMLCSELKTEAMLFILDRPFTKFIELCFSIPDLGDFHLIHAELCDYHTLDIEAVKQLNTLYQKHFGDEKHLKTGVSVNLFVCVWMKTSSEACAKSKDNLECIFQMNAEKYNPKENFLCNNAFTKWENLFTKQKEAAGWNSKRIKKFVQNQKEKRNNMFGKFIPQKKGVDSIQNHLLTQAQSLEDDGKEFSETNEKSLDDYLIQKRQYSLMKKNAYFSALSANNLCFMME